MKGLLYFVFLSITFIVKAQDTLYYKQLEDTIVCTQKEAKYYKIIDKTVSPFEVKTYLASNVQLGVEHFKTLNPAERSGLFIEYFSNGNTYQFGKFNNDAKDSIWQIYSEKPYYLSEKINYIKGYMHGKSFKFYPNGKLYRINFYSFDSLSQYKCYDTLGNEIECFEDYKEDIITDLTTLEIKPQYPGGDKKLRNFITKKLNYPKVAEEKRLEGKIVIKFYIDTDGSVKNPVIIKDGVGGGCAEEALRVVRMMPKWTPGTQKGKPVKVYYTMPIFFKLKKIPDN